MFTKAPMLIVSFFVKSIKRVSSDNIRSFVPLTISESMQAPEPYITDKRLLK